MSDIMGLRFVDVNDERIAGFNSLISPDTAEAITMPETYAIGALLPTEENADIHRAAGIIVFDFFREVGKTSPDAAVIRWLFVDEAQRRNGIGSRLVAHAAAAVAGTKVRKLRCDMPPSMAKEEFAGFFAARGFRRLETFGNRIEGTVGSLLSMASPMKEDGENVSRLSELPADLLKVELERMFRKFVIPNAEWLIAKGADWFDMDASCAVASGGRIGMLFLVHKRPSGGLQALVLRASDERTAEQDSCMMTALVSARAAYGFNAQLEIGCEREADQSYLSGFFRDWSIRQLTRMTADIGKM